MKTLFLICILFISTSAYSQKEEIDCFELLKRYEEPWRNDSLGANGFRIAFYFLFRGDCRKCSLNGLSFSEVEAIIGKPNSENNNVKNYWLGSDGVFWFYRMRLFINPISNLIEKTVFEVD